MKMWKCKIFLKRKQLMSSQNFGGGIVYNRVYKNITWTVSSWKKARKKQEILEKYKNQEKLL